MSEKKFTLDGRPLKIEEFIRDNDFPKSEVQKIRKMKIGEKIIYGGGAAAEFILHRTA